MTYPVNLTQACDPLPEFDGDTADDLVGYVIDLSGMYRSCSERHAGLAEALRP